MPPGMPATMVTSAPRYRLAFATVVKNEARWLPGAAALSFPHLSPDLHPNG